jgi:hypothetical protein
MAKCTSQECPFKGICERSVIEEEDTPDEVWCNYEADCLYDDSFAFFIEPDV